ncbi:MAG: GNAT family N-acetyltransferase [Actinomycetota bacterium]
MATHELVHWGDERLRLGPWRTRGQVAYLSPVPSGPGPRPDTVRQAVEVARARGFGAIVTAALTPHETGAFVAAGFEAREELLLLAHDLHDVPEIDIDGLRRARRGDRGRVLRIDAAAFDSFWTMDEIGLAEAIAATPSSRYRVVELGGEVVGYAVHGRSGSGGYVQRVAVDPLVHGRRLGAGLVVDGLRWMRRRGCVRAVVNTQMSNEKAHALYLRLGFTREPHGLHVLQLSLDGSTIPG